MKRHHFLAAIMFAALIGTVVLANWLVTTYGIITMPILGLAAPAGVYAAGLAFGLRDVLHDLGGRLWVVAAILVGAAVSALISPQFALASGAAFLLSEFADFAVYTPLSDRAHKNKNQWLWLAAVVASNLVGAVVDSALFLQLAFGSLDFLVGQVVGKAVMIIPILPIAWPVRQMIRRRDEAEVLAIA